ncbi:acetylornithine deacetylase [Paraglaciecola chathamensis]|uniref:Acetylornithine deacetylase n=1 Tax=Paraglaciecola chathamensis S18K6 TaxID=1127672 RepID=A0AAV3V1I6_9ALTE|nr:acetylornithine deacetylase [Paraglaciecola chathamensis]GAC10951.1 acetylornithine deacetylase [Paraglaciecola chathamensis S18K6]
MPSLSFLERYAHIINTPSISAFSADLDQSNRAIIDLLAGWFKDYKFNISIQQVPNARNKYNMLAKIGSGEGGLLLTGHSDTVPFDDNKWQFDPFKAQENDGKLYGLGTCDMKGFFAFILEAIQEIPLHKLKKPLYILATADEETSMAGARFFVEQQLIKPDMAIIGEPTELKPIFKHKGHMGHSLNIQGKAGHSSDPAKGVNAIEIMYQAIGKLIALKQQLSESHRDEAFSVPEVTMNLGHIHGGDGENRICGHCQLNFDLRAIPSLSDEEAIAMIDEALAPLVQKYPQRITREAMYETAPAFGCRNEQGILELAKKLTGFDPVSANYATEAPFINQLGCDTIVLGPGSIEQAHQPDEFISLHYVDPTVTLLRNFIKQVCF